MKLVWKKQKRANELRRSYVCFQILVVVSCRGSAVFPAALQELGEAFQCSFAIVVDHLWISTSSQSPSTAAELAAVNTRGHCTHPPTVPFPVSKRSIPAARCWDSLRRNDRLPIYTGCSLKGCDRVLVQADRTDPPPYFIRRQYTRLLDSLQHGQSFCCPTLARERVAQLLLLLPRRTAAGRALPT